MSNTFYSFSQKLPYKTLYHRIDYTNPLSKENRVLFYRSVKKECITPLLVRGYALPSSFAKQIIFPDCFWLDFSGESCDF